MCCDCDTCQNFIEDYRDYMHESAELHVVMLENALKRIYSSGRDDPQSLAGWKDFLALLRTNRPFDEKLRTYDRFLKSGFVAPSIQ
jgi:hypothetical protein